MRTTTAILDALVTRLRAVSWTPTGGGAETAFEAVHKFDQSDKERAFKQLLISDGRVAIAIYNGEEWADQETGAAPKLMVLRAMSLVVLVSDRNGGRRTVAAFGDERNPGALGLKDAALPSLAGNLIDVPDAVNLRPVRAQIEVVAADDFPDRVFCSIEIEATGGLITAAQKPAY